MDLKDLAEISRFYGSDPDILLAGGGNTSCKDEQYLYVKASGYRLADIGTDGFVRLNREALDHIWKKQYPADTETREHQALLDLMNARAAGETKRPSVESLLHAVLPWIYVVHTHPAIVNGLTCSIEGEKTAKRLFGSRCLWVPYVDPGYILACRTKKLLEAHVKKNNSPPEIFFLASHGMFVGGNTAEEVLAVHRQVMETLRTRIIRMPDFTALTTETDQEAVDKIAGKIKACPALGNAQVVFQTNREIDKLVYDASSFAVVHSAFTPDHIVYAGPESLFCADIKCLCEDIDDYRRRFGCVPRIIAVRQTGIFAVGDSPGSARTALELFLDSIKVAVYAASFGGGRFMTYQQINFIMHWEVEKFRARVSLGE